MRHLLICCLIVSLWPAAALAQSGATRELSPAQIRRLASNALSGVLPAGVELQEIQWNQPVRVPRGQPRAEAYLEGDEPVNGRLRARVEVLVGDTSVRTIRIRLVVRDRRQVVVATRQLRPGDALGPNDIALREPPPGVYLRQPLRSIEDAVGTVVTQLTESGEVIEQSSVRPPAAVRRRERVRIVSRVGGVEVIAPGEPLRDGSIGDIIQVLCLTSRRTIDARVVGPNEVEVR